MVHVQIYEVGMILESLVAYNPEILCGNMFQEEQLLMGQFLCIM
jgi:hypothetical protein